MKISPVHQLVGSILIGWLDSSAMSAGKVFKMKLDLFYMKQELMTTEHFLVKSVARKIQITSTALQIIAGPLSTYQTINFVKTDLTHRQGGQGQGGQ